MSISLGKSKGKTTSQNQDTTTKTLDPGLSAALYGNIASAKNAAASLSPFTGQRVAGFNPNQTAAQQGLLGIANAHVGSGLLEQATQGAERAAGFSPMQITPNLAAPPPRVSASTATARPDVQTSAITGDQIDNYLNPYTSDVVNTSLADLERQRQIEQTYNAAKATQAHAFGGTGSAILSSLTNDNYGRTAASTAANLRSQGFNTALGAAQQDAGRKLTADQGNQAAGNQVGLFNAGQTQGADIFNAGQTQSLNQFNAGQDLAAQQANQSAGISGAGLNLQATGLLGDLANKQRDFAVGDVGLLGSVGDAQQTQQQRELDAALAAWQQGAELTLQQQQLLNQAVGLLPDYGTVKSAGTASGTQKGTTAGISYTYGGSK